MSANQYDAAALRTELHAEFEALRLKLRAFSGRVSVTNPHFDETEFDKHAAECLSSLREDLEHIVEDADEAWSDAEQDEEIARYGTDLDQHATHRVINGRHF